MHLTFSTVCYSDWGVSRERGLFTYTADKEKICFWLHIWYIFFHDRKELTLIKGTLLVVCHVTMETNWCWGGSWNGTCPPRLHWLPPTNSWRRSVGGKANSSVSFSVWLFIKFTFVVKDRKWLKGEEVSKKFKMKYIFPWNIGRIKITQVLKKRNLTVSKWWFM